MFLQKFFFKRSLNRIVNLLLAANNYISSGPSTSSLPILSESIKQIELVCDKVKKIDPTQKKYEDILDRVKTAKALIGTLSQDEKAEGEKIIGSIIHEIYTEMKKL